MEQRELDLVEASEVAAEFVREEGRQRQRRQKRNDERRRGGRRHRDGCRMLWSRPAKTSTLKVDVGGIVGEVSHFTTVLCAALSTSRV